MISQSKIKEWVDLYLRHIAEITPQVHVQEEEGYKFMDGEKERQKEGQETFWRNYYSG